MLRKTFIKLPLLAFMPRLKWKKCIFSDVVTNGIIKITMRDYFCGKISPMIKAQIDEDLKR